MKLHGNACTCPCSRRLLVQRVLEQGWLPAAAAEAAGCSTRTAYKWLARYRAEGEAGLADRSSAPHEVPRRTPEDRVAAIAALRRLRMTAATISWLLSMPVSTVSSVLVGIGLGRLSRLEPPEPPNRYERRCAGELLHVDVKKLGWITTIGHRISGNRRGQPKGKAGWEYVHVCVDDATRLAYVEVLSDEKGQTVAGFLCRAVAFYELHGVRVERVMTDNGAGYCSILHALACRALGLRHLRTRPTGHAQTERPSASSAPCSAAGPTAPSTAAQPNAPAPSQDGSTTTIADDPTAASTARHPCSASQR
jgi:leucine-zipper of insertion element IS481/Integrase core domain